MTREILRPSTEQVEYYLRKWETLPDNEGAERILSKLFLTTCPLNVDIDDILIKVCVLNYFYHTNIYAQYTVAQHILDLKIDDRLQNGDPSLVNEIARTDINGKVWNFYSFATKYCSHHKPMDYPIFDSYVQAVLIYFKKKDKFFAFTQDDMKDCRKFKAIILRFREYYGLEKYNLKQLDEYLWLLGKGHF
jgi:hypothetical protein